MAVAGDYAPQVALLVRILPAVAEEACFVLKGGTAINLFVRNLPRLSVDIDLTYLPVEDREVSLASIDATLMPMTGRIEDLLPEVRVKPSQSRKGNVTKLVVRAGDTQVKVEVSPGLRGCVFEAKWRPVCPQVRDKFGPTRIRVVSRADLYAGKIVAALDRQHPRDLFDVRVLLASEGVDDATRRAFLVYLISHGRPMHEVLNARPKDIAGEFARNFVGMEAEPVTVNDLLAAREALVAQVVGAMPGSHRAFLIGFERGQPDWASLGLEHASQLPAVRWRQQNLDRLDGGQRGDLVARLEAVLSGSSRGPSVSPGPSPGL